MMYSICRYRLQLLQYMCRFSMLITLRCDCRFCAIWILICVSFASTNNAVIDLRTIYLYIRPMGILYISLSMLPKKFVLQLFSSIQ